MNHKDILKNSHRKETTFIGIIHKFSRFYFCCFPNLKSFLYNLEQKKKDQPFTHSPVLL